MEPKLLRNEFNKQIGGVCSGLADYFQVDVTMVRVCFVIAAFFGFGILAYIILWVVTPSNTDSRAKVEYFAQQFNRKQQNYQHYNAGPVNTAAPAGDTQGAQPVNNPFMPYTAAPAENFGTIPQAAPVQRNSSRVLGAVMVILGIVFTLQAYNFVPFGLTMRTILPVLLIIFGVYMVMQGNGSRPATAAPAGGNTPAEADVPVADSTIPDDNAGRTGLNVESKDSSNSQSNTTL